MRERQSVPSNRDRPPRVNMFRQLWVVFGIGALLATLYTAWTPLGLLPLDWGDEFSPLLAEDPLLAQITATARPRARIGIVAGHWGSDTGAMCPDGLNEVDINLDVATRVKALLIEAGYDVDLLMEQDDRLEEYKALALVSIHADSCEFIGLEATGFKVAPTMASARPQKSERLVACIYSRYLEATQLSFHTGITPDMSSYHAFEEIHFDTTAAIIETGFMNLDRQILTQHPDLVAAGIVNGILCYIRNEDASLPSGP